MEDIYAKYNLKDLRVVLTRCDDLLKAKEHRNTVEMNGSVQRQMNINSDMQVGNSEVDHKEENNYQTLMDRLGFQNKVLRVVLTRFDDNI